MKYKQTGMKTALCTAAFVLLAVGVSVAMPANTTSRPDYSSGLSDRLMQNRFGSSSMSGRSGSFQVSPTNTNSQPSLGDIYTFVLPEGTSPNDPGMAYECNGTSCIGYLTDGTDPNAEYNPWMATGWLPGSPYGQPNVEFVNEESDTPSSEGDIVCVDGNCTMVGASSSKKPETTTFGQMAPTTPPPNNWEEPETFTHISDDWSPGPRPDNNGNITFTDEGTDWDTTDGPQTVTTPKPPRVTTIPTPPRVTTKPQPKPAPPVVTYDPKPTSRPVPTTTWDRPTPPSYDPQPDYDPPRVSRPTPTPAPLPTPTTVPVIQPVTKPKPAPTTWARPSFDPKPDFERPTRSRPTPKPDPRFTPSRRTATTSGEKPWEAPDFKLPPAGPIQNCDAFSAMDFQIPATAPNGVATGMSFNPGDAFEVNTRGTVALSQEGIPYWEGRISPLGLGTPWGAYGRRDDGSAIFHNMIPNNAGPWGWGAVMARCLGGRTFRVLPAENGKVRVPFQCKDMRLFINDMRGLFSDNRGCLGVNIESGDDGNPTESAKDDTPSSQTMPWDNPNVEMKRGKLDDIKECSELGMTGRNTYLVPGDAPKGVRTGLVARRGQRLFLEHKSGAVSLSRPDQPFAAARVSAGDGTPWKSSGRDENGNIIWGPGSDLNGFGNGGWGAVGVQCNANGEKFRAMPTPAGGLEIPNDCGEISLFINDADNHFGDNHGCIAIEAKLK